MNVAGLPRPVRADGLPDRVTVYEVGPRDGLQAEADVIPAAVKIQLCRRLYAAGVRGLELTSFVPASWIPQLADAAEVVEGVTVPEGARGVALVPNLRGLHDALVAGVTEVAVVVSATESFARANLNASRVEAVGRALGVVAEARARGLAVRGYVSMSFGDPWEGLVDEEVVVETAARLAESGCRTVVLGDTIGVATPGQVEKLIAQVVDAGSPVGSLALHLHDTYGQSLANVLAALRLGVTEFDAAVGGLGRCPYAAGATGNLATEDLVWMLDGLGIDSGLDLRALVETTRWLSALRGVPAPSRVARAVIAATTAGRPLPTREAIPS